MSRCFSHRLLVKALGGFPRQFAEQSAGIRHFIIKIQGKMVCQDTVSQKFIYIFGIGPIFAIFCDSQISWLMALLQ